MKIYRKLNSVVLIAAFLAFLTLISTASAAQFAYVVNTNDNTASIIDTATDTVTATIPVGNYPTGVAMSPDGTKVYITNGYDYGGNTLSVIDTATNTVTATVNVGDWPLGVSFTPDGKKSYVANAKSNTVSVIDTTTNTVTATISVGTYPLCVALNPAGTRAYVVNNQGNTISVIDTANDRIINTISSGLAGDLMEAQVSPDGKKLYVPGQYNDKLYVIDTSTDSVIKTVDIGDFPQGLTIKPDGTRVYITSRNENKVYVIDTSADSVTTTIPVGDYPACLKATPDGAKVYVMNVHSNTVSVIDTTMNTVTVTVNVGNWPNGWGQFIGVIPISVIPSPTVGFIKVPVDPIPVATSITASASVDYKGTWNTLTAEWNWGDGSTSQSQVSSNFETSHVYNSPGIYTVNLKITDADGKSETKEAPNYIVVYDPNGGFVTGGGWINSPAGAYASDKTLSGKATFGFVSKYQKGANVPTGKTEFQFNAGDLNFHSEKYDWLVIAGSQAKFKGTGTINDQGNYGFMLSAVDGTPDKFRIKIWDKVSNAIVYDNEIKATGDAEPTTSIGGGSVIIHTAK